MLREELLETICVAVSSSSLCRENTKKTSILIRKIFCFGC